MFTGKLTIANMKNFSLENGDNFFEYNPRRETAIECNPTEEGFFISSEKDIDEPTTRRYTVRRFEFWDGDVKTVGDYLEHGTKEEALKAMEKYAEEWRAGTYSELHNEY
jgi:hypothetical protein